MEKYTLVYIAQLETESEFCIMINKKEYEELSLWNALYKIIPFLQGLKHIDPICRLEVKYDGNIIWSCFDRKVLNEYFN